MRGTARSAVQHARLGAVLALVFSSSIAHAAECPTNLPNIIYGSGGSAVTATMRQVAAALRALPDPITVLWHDPGTCTGFGHFLDEAIPGTTTRNLVYWDAAGVATTCQAPTAAGLPVDFAHMGNTADFCAAPRDVLPPGYGDFLAPVQIVNLVTDKDSSQKSISAEALFYIFGLGAAAAGVEPWTNPRHMVLRTTSSFAHQFIAASVFGDPLKVFYDHPSITGRVGIEGGAESLSSIVSAGTSNPESPLGYVSGSAADAGRAQIKTLAYQHFGQTCAYWPDSSESSLDKVNVRQGLYHFWTPGHFFAPVNSQGQIISHRPGADATERAAIAERVRQLIGYFSGELPSPAGISPPILQRIISAGDIPLCAMQVTREGT
ncbi:MAG TPA: hypothetical protein VMS65_09535, partial [Polyangiaceae bacterium]|nr:hypothetical protein [Polyangiaceae bacterium]